MRILVLGGTAFLGRWFVEIASSREHELTLFNRGLRNSELFPDLERIQGDRTTDLSKLDGRSWDAVFDTSGYVPRVVGMSAEKLRGMVDRYVFISSISVYKSAAVPNQDESAEVATLADPSVEEVTGETYGALKALCEQAVESVFGERAINVRPGLIVGPHDPTDRFTYWPWRMSRGGDVLVPDVKDQPVQVIDVRDLAEWCLDLLENRGSGTFNGTGPSEPYRLQDVLIRCAAGTGADLVWASPSFLKEHEVQPWSDLPFVLDYDGSSNGMLQMDISRAVAAGLRFRPLKETIRDTRDWALSRPADHDWKAGLSSERQRELLELWASRSVT